MDDDHSRMLRARYMRIDAGEKKRDRPYRLQAMSVSALYLAKLRDDRVSCASLPLLYTREILSHIC